MVVQEALHQLPATAPGKQQFLLEEEGKHLGGGGGEGGGEEGNICFTSSIPILCHEKLNFQSSIKLVLRLTALILQCTAHNTVHLPRVT